MPLLNRCKLLKWAFVPPRLLWLHISQVYSSDVSSAYFTFIKVFILSSMVSTINQMTEGLAYSFQDTKLLEGSLGTSVHQGGRVDCQLRS